ncbi:MULTISPECIES: hypothetical protein [Burkholderiaceae]|uniref:hypothetical protein n=1 Tax=Burkholderiaceae TaxID=119060 RepID=UPI000966C8EB|nr:MULTISPECIES: hypothetical protein [Burkholderiaceae]MCG1040895.1 hypothetical protein [Mycetohabitans sp. B7]SIT64865.1 hypothetical protein SAMN04487769_0068 [Burkholderia sp. b14]
MPHFSDRHTQHTSVVPQPSQPLETLAKHFSAGHIPSQQDFHDVIDMAAATYTLIDSGRGPGDGLELDDHNTLRVQTGEGVRVSENGVSLAVEPNGALQFNEARQLTLDRHKVLSVEAVKALPEADRAAIWQELKSATPPANGGVRASAASLAPLSRRTAIASAIARKLPQSEQALNVLQSHFASGHIPTEDDFHDLITLASASYLLAGSDNGVGAGLMLDETGRLAVQASPGAGIHADEHGVRLALEQNGGLQWGTTQQLQLDVTHVVSLAALQSLPNEARYKIYQLLMDAVLYENFGREQSWAAHTVGDDEVFSRRTVAAVSADGRTIAYKTTNKRNAPVVRVYRRTHWSETPETTVDIDIPLEWGDALHGFYIAVSERGQMIAISQTDPPFCCVYEIDDHLNATKMHDFYQGPLLVVSIIEGYIRLITVIPNGDNSSIYVFTYDIVDWKLSTPLEKDFFIFDAKLSSDQNFILVIRISDVYVYDMRIRFEATIPAPHSRIGATIPAPNGKFHGDACATLSKDGSQVIVGTRTSDGVSHASIYTLNATRDTWKLTDTLDGPSSAQPDRERRTVNVCTNDRGDIAIGQSTDDVHEVYVYYRGTAGWSEAHRLTANTPASRYGARVDMSADGSVLLVMAEDRVYVYSRTRLIT